MSRSKLVASTAIGALVIVSGLIAVFRDVDGGAEPISRPPSATRGELPAVAPLTGLPADTDLNHPAVAIKVSDVRHAHPQVGVDDADIVFAEPIGVSYTRLAAVFHSTVPELVGPVRSVRPADAPLLGPLAAAFGNTMGAGWVMDYVDSVADLDDLGTLRAGGSDAYVIDSDRPAPDHVFVRPGALLELSDRTAPPSPYFAYVADGAPNSAEATGGPGSIIEISYGPSWQVVWTYDAASGTYLRDEPWGPHVMADGTRISAVNVLVLDVTATVGKIGTGSGAPVPILDLVDASGRFQAFAGGHRSPAPGRRPMSTSRSSSAPTPATNSSSSPGTPGSSCHRHFRTERAQHADAAPEAHAVAHVAKRPRTCPSGSMNMANSPMSRIFMGSTTVLPPSCSARRSVSSRLSTDT